MADRAPFGINLTERFVSDGGEEELFVDREIDNHGSVTLVDYMGGDATVERAATAGHGRSIFPESTSELGFLSYLAVNGIVQPFKFAQLKFSVQAPIEVALNPFVYEPGCSVNEYSGRYSEMLDSAHIPSENEIMEMLDESDRSCRAQAIHYLLKTVRSESEDNYRKLLDSGLTRELARGGLGTNNDTRFFWKIDLANLADIVKRQRSFSGTGGTGGIQDGYVEAVASIADQVFPNAWQALMNPREMPTILTLPRDNVVVDDKLNEPGWDVKETRRVVVSSMEDRLFSSVPFLDHGEFQAVDYMGDINAMAEAARTSYGTGTSKVQDNINLVRSLIRDAHTSPVEMAELAFEVKAPVFTDPRQAGRHRTLDFVSFMGYVPKGDFFYVPPAEELKTQDLGNRQGRAEELEDGKRGEVEGWYRDSFEKQLVVTGKIRDAGGPEHLVRAMKGVSFFTRISRTGDLHNLAHYLHLRLDPHAQTEIRQEAALVADAYEALAPEAFKAQKDYRLDGMRLSRMEVEVAGRICSMKFGKTIDLDNLELYKGQGWVLTKKDGSGERYLGREGKGFQDKLKRILGE